MDWSPGSFALGFLVAALVFAGILFATLQGIANDGLTVPLDPAPVSEKLEDAIMEEAEAEMARVIHSVREDLPSQVAEEVAGSFDQLTLTIYGVEIPLPDEVIERLEEQLRESLAGEMQTWVQNLQWEERLEQLSGGTEEGLKAIMENSSLMRFNVQLPGPLAVPVRIVPADDLDDGEVVP